LVAVIALMAQRAQAAGLYLAPTGVGPLGQAGAVVASTADPLALVYNPAGMSWAPSSALVDGALPLFYSAYTRHITAAGPPLPTVRGRPLGLVSPNVGVVLSSGRPGAPRLGALVSADYPLLQAWPDGAAHPDSPQRYATGGFGGTALVKALVGGAWAPTPALGLGANLQLLLGRLQSQSTLSTCDGVVCSQAENPAYDATARLRSALLVAPGFGLGAMVKARPWLTFGLSYSSALAVEARAQLQVRLPRAPLFGGARLVPPKPSGRLRLRLPGVLRAGARITWPRRLEVEAAVSYVPWHVHRSLTLDALDAAVTGVIGVDSFRIGAVEVPRKLKDTVAGHLAIRHKRTLGAHGLVLQGGLMVEPSAVPDAMLTALAVDLPKGLLSLSAVWRHKATEVTLSYGAMGMLSRRISHSAVRQINPLLAPDSPQLTAVGNGLYRGWAQLVGLGVALFF
jgi:long-subunit fatty acid transport protein